MDWVSESGGSLSLSLPLCWSSVRGTWCGNFIGDTKGYVEESFGADISLHRDPVKGPGSVAHLPGTLRDR